MVTKYNTGDIIYVPVKIKSAIDHAGKIFYEPFENSAKAVVENWIPEEAIQETSDGMLILGKD